MTHTITNKLLTDIKIGDQAQILWHVSARETQVFNIQTPANDVSSKSANTYGTSLLIKALLTRLFKTELPGPGSELLNDNLNYHELISFDDDLTLTVRVAEKHPEKQLLILEIECRNQEDILICDGKVTLKTSNDIIAEQLPEVPEIVLFNTGYKFKHLIAEAQNLCDTPRVAVVHPMNAETLQAAVTATTSNLIIPTFIAPLDKLKTIAAKIKVDLSQYTCIDVPHSHAAAKRAVEMARNGEVDALMKGSLHTDELMHEVVDATTGIRTDKRITHCFVMDVPAYPKLLTISDAAINITPDLIDKQNIVQNAINLLHALGTKAPKVAILAAIENVNPKMPATIDAAALCKMADRGQITGGILDGPLAFDNAISRSAANIKGIKTPVAGDVDILIVPDLDSGNMLVKELSYLSGAIGAGIVLGAKVPIILTSRADPPMAREASCALVKYYICHLKLS
jgi:phosphate acetyltransferase